ncbi:MAG: GYD domain-containing protein [Chloroflexi bacterium]|nr:GYD domain-containing protein [Chloroflexota bacterium]
MPKYVVLYKFTELGLKNIKGTVQRAEQVRKDNEARGFKVLGIYWTQGRYDLVAIMDAPSEEAMVGGLFNVAQAGNVHSETLRAFDAGEMDRILKQA